MANPLNKYDYLTIGILGGMGIEAGTELTNKVAELFQKGGAEGDDDFPEIVHVSIPCYIVGVDDSDPETIARFLKYGCKKLDGAGADFVVVACNSAHAHEEEMRGVMNIPLVSIVDETVRAVKDAGVDSVLLLSVGYTVGRRVFDGRLAEAGINVVIPTEEESKLLDSVCLDVVRGKNDSDTKKKMMEVIGNYRDQIKGVILGCTEFPLVVSQDDFQTLKIFDTVDILAKAAHLYSSNPSALKAL